MGQNALDWGRLGPWRLFLCLSESFDRLGLELANIRDQVTTLGAELEATEGNEGARA